TIAPPGCECQPAEPPGSTVICAMATSVPNLSGMVPCDVLVPRAKGVFTSPIGGVAQLGATVAATVTAVTTLASPTPTSVLLAARFMPSSRPWSACIGDAGDKDVMAFQPPGWPVRRGPWPA